MLLNPETQRFLFNISEVQNKTSRLACKEDVCGGGIREEVGW